MDSQDRTEAMESRFRTVNVRVVRYKGISGAIRRAILSGELEGKITPLKIKKVLPQEKLDAPSNVIYKSLKYLAKRKEIQVIGGAYYPMAYQDPALNSQVIVKGSLMNTEVINGQLCAKVKIDTMEVQKS